mgnify:FL=1
MLKNWDYTRKSYINWLSNTTLRNQFFKRIKFEDLSLWWITNLMNKDNRNNTIWYSRLNKKLNNKKENKVIRISYLKFLLVFLKKLISTIISNVLIRIFLPNNIKFNNNKDCFYTLVNNLVIYKNKYLDRQYGLTTIKKKNEKNYIVEVPSGILLIKNIFQIRKKLKRSHVRCFTLNSQYKTKDIIYVYYKTLVLLVKTIKILKKKNYFIIANKDCRKILEPELISSYFGTIQDQILKGIALKRSLMQIKPKNFITYFCFYPEARSQYYFARASKVKNIVNINHAIYTKQNIFWNFSSKDFSSTDSSKFSPRPDIFICKGDQDYKELKKLFKTQKLYHVGCLKTDIRNFVIKNYLKVKRKNSNKIITVLSGETDYKSITKVLNQCKLEDYTILIEPHPLMKNKTIKYFEKKLIHNFKLGNKISREELFRISNFILFGDTQLGTELAIQNYNVIRIYEKSFIPQYEVNNKFPFACDGNKLQKLLKQKKLKFKAKSLERDYFYKYDFKASNRFQNILDKL